MPSRKNTRHSVSRKKSTRKVSRKSSKRKSFSEKLRSLKRWSAEKFSKKNIGYGIIGLGTLVGGYYANKQYRKQNIERFIDELKMDIFNNINTMKTEFQNIQDSCDNNGKNIFKTFIISDYSGINERTLTDLITFINHQLDDENNQYSGCNDITDYINNSKNIINKYKSKLRKLIKERDSFKDNK